MLVKVKATPTHHIEKANKGTLVIELMHLPRTLTDEYVFSPPSRFLIRSPFSQRLLEVAGTTSLYNFVATV